jgi:hypothetical protein
MPTMGGDTNKGLLLPYFDGDPKNFKGWWMRFKAFATIKGFSPSIQRTKEAELPNDESTDVSSDVPKQNAKNRNLMAIACLTAAFQDDGLLNMIEQSMISTWPSGLAYVVVDELFKRYRPVDIISRVEMRTRLNQVKMTADEDPRAMFDQLASIQSAYNDATRKIDPDDLIAVVLEKAPAAYKSILTAEQRSKGTNLKLEDLRNCMNDLYRTLNPSQMNSEAEDDVALMVQMSTFTGICGYCNKAGHTEEKCWHKNANRNTNKTLRPCRHCGGKHMDFKCWELPSNAQKRPTNWRSRAGNEVANIAREEHDNDTYELLLSNVDRDIQFFPEQKDLLLNPNIWIGDSAATVHMTPHDEGMIDIKNMCGSITVGNGQTMTTTKTGNIKCEIPNKRNKTTKTGLLTDVCLTKSSPFNLFSLRRYHAIERY